MVTTPTLMIHLPLIHLCLMFQPTKLSPTHLLHHLVILESPFLASLPLFQIILGSLIAVLHTMFAMMKPCFLIRNLHLTLSLVSLIVNQSELLELGLWHYLIPCVWKMCFLFQPLPSTFLALAHLLSALNVASFFMITTVSSRTVFRPWRLGGVEDTTISMF